jgi:hypothetical protein
MPGTGSEGGGSGAGGGGEGSVHVPRQVKADLAPSPEFPPKNPYTGPSSLKGAPPIPPYGPYLLPLLVVNNSLSIPSPDRPSTTTICSSLASVKVPVGLSPKSSPCFTVVFPVYITCYKASIKLAVSQGAKYGECYPKEMTWLSASLNSCLRAITVLP